MDIFWTDVADYLKRSADADTRIVGPADFGSSLNLIQQKQSELDVNDIDVLILHKTNYDDLSPCLVSDVLASFAVGFANEVFIVFTRNSQEVFIDLNHLGALDNIRSWARADYHEGQHHTIVPRGEPRMAPCYMGQNRVLLQTAYGHLMLVAGGDTSITPHLIRDGWFDIDLTRFLTRTLKPGGTFVDVGANYGTYALIGAEIVGQAGHVLAVEANPSIAEMLHENLVMNGFGERATVMRNAAGAKAGTIEMFTFAIRQGGSTMVPRVAHQAESDYGERLTPQKVLARTLDEMLEATNLKAIDLLKIDVEGYEASVLAGAIDCISRMRPKLLLEWHSSFITADLADEMYNSLTQRFGYRLRRVEADGVTRPIEYDELMATPHSDILAYPSSDY